MMQFDQHLDPDRRAQHVTRGRQNANGEHIIKPGRLDLAFALDNDQQIAAMIDGFLHSRE